MILCIFFYPTRIRLPRLLQSDRASLLFWTRLLVFLTCANAAIAHEYEAEGTLGYFVGETNRWVFSRDFTLRVSDCAWAIRIDAKDVKGVAYFEVLKLGRSIYSYKAF